MGNEECYISGLEILFRLARQKEPVVLGNLAGCNLGEGNKHLEYYVSRGLINREQLGNSDAYELSERGKQVVGEAVSHFKCCLWGDVSL
ncbi:MAG: hypothetical protein PHH00_02250 [Candidatus Nanoarchaeia archaeon]|nr:hypothetical protein [Candidatus Nanoarchaeia archaeon]